MRLPFSNTDGITVRELRHVLGQVPDQDENGEENVVLIAAGNCHLSVLTDAVGFEDGTLMLAPAFWVETMQELETWDSFTADD